MVVVDAKGCQEPQSFTIQQPNPLIATIERFKAITCNEAADGAVRLISKR